MRYFYVTYVAEPDLQIALDAIRLLADPTENTLAHITIQGPYSELPTQPLATLALEGQVVRVLRTGDFFRSNQNTVFLECECDGFHERWFKPNYEYRPHITIYDGPSRAFARQLRKLLSRHPAELTFHSTGLALLRSMRGQFRESLRQSIDTVGLSWLLSEQVTAEDVVQMSEQRRLVLIERLWREVLKRFSHHEQHDPQLFKGIPSFAGIPIIRSQKPSTRKSYRSLQSLVVDAYLAIHNGASIDRVIADPKLNGSFISKCWSLGAQASQYELDRALLNARKQGRIGRVIGVQRHSVDRSALDQYLFASEIALRLVQDEEWLGRTRYVSLDRILCEPTLSYRFDQFARSIIPGFAPSDYRWAAIALRKAQNRPAPLTRTNKVAFDMFGRLDSLVPGDMPPAASLYRLSVDEDPVYFGNSENMRKEFVRLASVRLGELPVIYRSTPLKGSSLRLAVAPAAELSSTVRDYLKSQLIRQSQPSMNIMLQPLCRAS